MKSDLSRITHHASRKMMYEKKNNINQKLIWDYDFSEADYETEAFKEWYVARVLTRGGIDDIRNIGIQTIKGYLLRIHLPKKIREFWEWYFNRNELRFCANNSNPERKTNEIEILTSFQKELLKQISKSILNDDFYLTGGTALSAFYLQHRISEDLDFFTANPNALRQVPSILQDVAQEIEAQTEFRRLFGSFIECFIQSKGNEIVKIDFALDSPFQFETPHFDGKYGIYINSLIDIACGKMSALYDRAEPKDFVDVYFIAKEVIDFDTLLRKAKEKHLGLDDYWFAQSLLQVNRIQVLPRMIREITIVQLRDFFVKQVEKLMERLDTGYQ